MLKIEKVLLNIIILIFDIKTHAPKVEIPIGQNPKVNPFFDEKLVHKIWKLKKEN